MARVTGIGETVIDIIFRDDKPLSARPGGSVLNTLVSLGRLGVDCRFISDYGKDEPGRLTDRFLADNGVNTDLVERMENYRTAIALAFLDDKSDATYSFYKEYPEERLNDIKVDFDEGDIFLFGSFFAISYSTRKALKRVLSEAYSSGATIIYDPNFRKPHLHELETVRPMIIENMSFADIVRGSDEDFKLIFGAHTPREAYRYVRDAGCRNLVYTANKEEVVILTENTEISLEVPLINPVSTIGAGDNFNAGIIWTLIRNELKKSDLEALPENTWKEIGRTGIGFSAEVCSRMDNYISEEFAELVARKRD